MPMINVFIAGTQKGGTSALAEFLAEHPEVALVQGKEAHIFDQENIAALSAQDINQCYQKLLAHYNNQAICCDATPLYMYFTDIPARLAAYNSNAKIIILLRDPVARAFSHYQMEKRRGDEPFSFARALLAESYRLKQSANIREFGSAARLHSYRHRGLYSQQLDNIYRAFCPSQVLVLRNDELLNAHQKTLDKICNFLGIKCFSSQPRSIFAGHYRVSLAERVTLFLLRLSYWPEYRRLKRKYAIDFD